MEVVFRCRRHEKAHLMLTNVCKNSQLIGFSWHVSNSYKLKLAVAY
ncbi:hypothetical protein SOVF_109040 [Spinacia oleracea]|nr:hypothetical protein SOVF_109040 [Spinacia oleracea]